MSFGAAYAAPVLFLHKGSHKKVSPYGKGREVLSSTSPYGKGARSSLFNLPLW